MDRSVLSRKPMTELKDIASHLNLRGYQKLRKAELIEAIISGGAGAGEVDQDGPAQQELATEGGDAAAEARRREEARKVLPPSARPAEQPAEVAAEEGGRPGREPSAGGPADPEAADGPPETPSDERADRTREDDRTQADDRGGPADDVEDDEGDDGRARRSRRDRRKRNRDRQGEEVGGPDEPAQDQPAASGGAQERGGQDVGGQQARGSRAERSGGPTVPPSGNDPGEVRAGVLDILPEGYGFLRTTGYTPGERDVYVSQGQIRKHGLRRGDVVQGPIRQQRSNEKVPALHHIQRVNGEELEEGQVPERPTFEQLTVIFPDERISLSGEGTPDSARLIDLFAPIGRGQRALVIAPARSGKTALLREIGRAVVAASPDAHVMAVLVDERPEEIAETVRDLPGEVIASSFDQPAEDHAQIADLAIERARRLVELGHDVVVLLDSATRLVRAHGVTAQANGRLIAPGVEAAAMYPAKRFLAAARNTSDAGSLTVIATVLDGTASPTDHVVLDELTRVASTVIHLDPTLVARRVAVPIDVLRSGTDDEASLQDVEDLAIIKALRRTLGTLPPDTVTELLLDKLAQTDSAEALLAQLRDAGQTAQGR